MSEVNTEVQSGREQVIRWVTVLAVVTVAVIAAIQSYSHMHDLAFAAGEQWRSHLFPISVDGLVVAASMVLLSQQIMTAAGRMVKLGHRLFAAGALAMGVIVSLSANIADAWDRGLLPRAIAGWPAVAFAVVFHLLLIQWKSVASEGEPAGQEPLATSIASSEVVATPPLAMANQLVMANEWLTVSGQVAKEADLDWPVASTLAKPQMAKPQMANGQLAKQPRSSGHGQMAKRAVASGSTADDVAKLVAKSMTDDAIATELGLSTRTVRRHRTASTNGHVTS